MAEKHERRHGGVNYPSGEDFGEALGRKNFRTPMLWQTWSGADLTDWLVSEKLDGVRAWWDGATLRTRTGRPIIAPNELLAALPPGFALDGELYAGRGALHRVQLAVRGQSADWAGVRYHVFDAPEVAGGFAERLEAAREESLGRSALILPVPHEKALGRRWIAERFASVRAAGGEGLVARMPDAPYRWSLRDGGTLKIKARPDSPLLLAAA